jgi:hypothetical protein
MSTTIVTAFFDINRGEKGDGRKIEEYLEWIKKTLLLNCNLYVVTEAKFVKFIKDNRPNGFPLIIKEDTLQNASYYKYLPQMKEILESAEYKNRIAYPNRVECKLPEYNIIQYSKFGWLERAITENPFNTEYFFWMDIGISRFYLDVNVSQFYPGKQIINNSNDKFIIQCRYDLYTYPINENFIWGAENLFKGTMFGGKKEIVLKIGNELENVFKTEMLKQNNVNNEQLGLLLVWKKNPKLFHIIDDDRKYHLILFKLLSY